MKHTEKPPEDSVDSALITLLGADEDRSEKIKEKISQDLVKTGEETSPYSKGKTTAVEEEQEDKETLTTSTSEQPPSLFFSRSLSLKKDQLSGE